MAVSILRTPDDLVELELDTHSLGASLMLSYLDKDGDRMSSVEMDLDISDIVELVETLNEAISDHIEEEVD